MVKQLYSNKGVKKYAMSHTHTHTHMHTDTQNPNKQTIKAYFSFGPPRVNWGNFLKTPLNHANIDPSCVSGNYFFDFMQ